MEGFYDAPPVIRDSLPARLGPLRLLPPASQPAGFGLLSIRTDRPVAWGDVILAKVYAYTCTHFGKMSLFS